MAGLNFDVAFSGIFAAQRAIKVAQNNITNINTEGYARQQMNVSPNTSLAGGGIDMQIGNGVTVENIERLKDDFLIAQSRAEKGRLGYFQSMRESLSAVEVIFNENGDGSVSQLLGEFFNAWEELSKYPEENSYRNALLSTTNQLVNKFREINDGLNEVEAKLDNDIVFRADKANELIAKIADVNKKISRSITENPNSLLDERIRYLDQLASYVDIEVSKDIKNPMLANVKAGGVSLINGTEVRFIEPMFEAGENAWILTTGNTMMHPTGGMLAADVELRNGKIADYKQQVNTLVSTLIAEINAIHQGGYGLDNATGNDFFVGTGIHNIGVNPMLQSNPEQIAVSSKTDAPGNADIASAISNLRSQNMLSGGTMNPIGYYNGFAIAFASDVHMATDNEWVHERILMNVESERQNVQGVSLDEELANLLKFEQYYAANSKVITTVDKLYDVLLQMF